MLLGYNTNGLQNHRLPDALRLLADHGFEAVALTLDVGHLDPFTVTSRDVDAIAALLTQLRLVPVIETGGRFVLDPARKHEPTLMTRDAAGRRRRLDFYSRCAAIGRDLGAEVVSFFTGVDRGPAQDAAATLESGVAQACEAIRGVGLVPALEPEPGMAVETVSQALALPDAAGRPDLCVDLGHLYATGEGEPDEILPAVAGRLAQVHLEDMRRGVHEHLPPGAGDMDFRAAITALQALGYAGPVCFELSRDSHRAPEMLATCASVWRASC